MKEADIVVIGGSAAGIAAAITARRHYPEKSILVIRKEDQVLIPCGIPYIFGTVASPENNLIPDAVLDKNNVDLLIDKVEDIKREDCTLSLASGDSVSYDRLIIATGASPLMPPIPGFELDNVYTIKKDVNYLTELQEDLKDAERLVILGGGFIGVEFADECNKLDWLDATIVELLPHCLMLAYDEEFCTRAEALLSERGVDLRTKSKVAKFKGEKTVDSVQLEDGTELDADAVIVAVGVRANAELAEKAGLRLGPTGGVAVDRTMRTEDERIFACGDCAEKFSFFGGKPSPLKLASIAASEARIAGANLFETRRENIGTVGVWSTCIGDTAFATAGLTEQLAEKNGYSYVSGEAEAGNRHPGGMPGLHAMKVKLVFEKHTGEILGGTIMGGKAAGELINAISACIQNRMTAEDIAVFQIGTHPALTASPIAYQFVNAAESAAGQIR
ncbi:MAG: FAD-dependent oxidoreductase [Planctomycetes bacterium]|nr:FAD-dependent oxidoreductase [Planctomycetota bacterium]